MNVTSIWLIINARRSLFLSVLLPLLVAVLVFSYSMPKTYLATTSLVIDTKTTDPVTGNAAPTGETALNILGTQLDIILSHTVSLKVVDRLKLIDDPYFKKQFSTDARGQAALRDVIAYYIAERLSASLSSKDSNVINIVYSNSDPATAANFANAYADSFIQTSLELREDPARREAAWFEQQILALRLRVDSAQQRLLDAQRASSIVGTEDHIDVDTNKLTEISTQLVASQQVLYDSRNRLKQMNEALTNGTLDALPDIINNDHLQTLKTDLARAESTFAEIASRYDQKHPQYLSAQATVKSLEGKVASEIEAVRGSIEQTAEISQRQVTELQHALDEQKATLLNAKRQHDSLEVLNHELQSAQAAYDSGMQRASDVRLASELNQSSIAVLTPAVPPVRASRPKPLLYFLLALVLGSLLSVGICLSVEIADRRIRSAEDVAHGSHLEVLAEVPRIRMQFKQL
jgi:chain length determinant protein EpsF